MRPVEAVLLLVAVCLLAALALRSGIAGTEARGSGAAIMGIAAPRSAVEGERYVAYGGVSLQPNQSYVVRVCAQSGGCPVRRTVTANGSGSEWGWLATFSPALPAGTYVADVFVRGQGPLGAERTLEHFRWQYRVE